MLCGPPPNAFNHADLQRKIAEFSRAFLPPLSKPSRKQKTAFII
ncbi:MAG: hypothetical protein ACJAYH_000493 [Celeribacter sp.]|jgi:hypothetical protein